MRSAAEAQNHTLEREEMPAQFTSSSDIFPWSRWLLAALAAASLTSPLQPASAEQFPDRPIRIIVPVGAGGGTDVFARALADTASSALGQPVVVENRPGASGTIGVQQVINASPDGYTIGFVWNSPLTAAPHSTNARYTPDDYVAMFDIGYSAYTLCAQPSFPANSLKEMIEEVRTRPNTYTWGNEGAGGTLHLGVERVLQTLGLKMTVVPFQGGSQSLNALLGGHISFYGGSVVVGMGAIRAKTMKCLLLTTAENNPEVPGASGLASIGTRRPRRDDLVGNDRAERHPRRADGASSNSVSRRAAKRPHARHSGGSGRNTPDAHRRHFANGNSQRIYCARRSRKAAGLTEALTSSCLAQVCLST